MVRLCGHLVSVLTRLLSPDTVRHPRVHWSGGGTSQDDNGGLDPLHRGLSLLNVDLGVLDGVDVDVRGPDLTGVLGGGPTSESFILFRGEQSDVPSTTTPTLWPPPFLPWPCLPTSSTPTSSVTVSWMYLYLEVVI
jgi:hypothetical protein